LPQNSARWLENKDLNPEGEMFRSIAVATAALAIVVPSIVHAQRFLEGAGDDGAGGPRVEQRYHPSIEDIKAFTDARIAALKAGLQLTPDQEKNWPAFEQAIRDLAKLHLARLQAREARQAGGDRQPADPFARLQNRAEALSQFGTALKHVADTGAPLYQSLNDAQKHRFGMLAHMLRPHWMLGGFAREHHGQGGMGQGMMGHGRMDQGMMDQGQGMGGRDEGEEGSSASPGMTEHEPDHHGHHQMSPQTDDDSEDL
jgi:zinc resistance-associated protein